MMADLKAEQLDAAFMRRFGVTVTTSWGIFTMCYVTAREDGEDMTAEQQAWLDGWSERGLAA